MDLEEIDEQAAKQRVKEATWAWLQRSLVLAVTFGFGFFAAWVTFGSGEQGAIALRVKAVEQEQQIIDLKKRRNDAEGQYEVANTRLSQCQKKLQETSTELAAMKAAAAAAPAPGN